MRVAVLVLVMVAFSPSGQILGEAGTYNSPSVILEDVMDTYSRSV